MAGDTQNNLVYYATIDLTHKESLGCIRLWVNIKLAYDRNTIWLKNLTEEQTESFELRSIPGCSFYFEKNNKIYMKGSLLPTSNVPSLLWTPINSALPISLPKYNDNFMGMGDQQILVGLVPSEEEQDAFAMIVEAVELDKYIQSASAIRLKNLRWTILSDSKIFIEGVPLLPIKGDVFWRYKRLLLPAGFKLNYSLLSDYINEYFASEDVYFCWLDQSSYIKIRLDMLEHLSIASYRTTYTI